MTYQEQVDKVINERIQREFAQAAAELNARTKPKAQPTPKPKAQPKPKRVTTATLNALERRIDQIEDRLTPKSWAAAVAHIGKRDKVSMAEAGKRAAREYPGLHPARRAK